MTPLADVTVKIVNIGTSNDQSVDAKDNIPPPSPLFAIGDYITVQHDDKNYVANVLEFDEDDGEYQVAFMEQKVGGFQSPGKPDILCVRQDDIIAKIAAPLLSGRCGRFHKLQTVEDNAHAFTSDINE